MTVRVKMKIDGGRLEPMARSLEPLLKMRDVVGYKAALNMRAIRPALEEYEAARNGLIREFGDEVKDDEGRVVDVAVTPESEGFGEFMARLAEISAVEHEIALHMASTDEVIGRLSGEEMLAAAWMIDGWQDLDAASNEGGGR